MRDAKRRSGLLEAEQHPFQTGDKPLTDLARQQIHAPTRRMKWPPPSQRARAPPFDVQTRQKRHGNAKRRAATLQSLTYRHACTVSESVAQSTCVCSIQTCISSRRRPVQKGSLSLPKPVFCPLVAALACGRFLPLVTKCFTGPQK